MPGKCILILLDGLGDRSHGELGGKTPLQAARTPALDALAAGGASGLYHAAALGRALPSETAHFRLFGYDPLDFPGRGVLEALGAGIDLSPADVALLTHFVSLSEEGGLLVMKKGKPKADPEELAALMDVVSPFDARGVRIRFHHTGGIYGVLTLSGDVSPCITDSEPFIDGRPLAAVTPWRICSGDKPAQNAAGAVTAYMRWAYARLKGHEVNVQREKKGSPPINGVTTQRAGRLRQVVPFEKKYGLRGLILADGLVYWGLGAYIGMDVEKLRDSGDPGADMARRLERAQACLGAYDFIHVHSKAPDEAGHTKDPRRKKAVIESLDAAIGRAIGPLLKNPEVLVVVTADHSTPSSGPLIHSGESVPLVMYGRGVRKDTVKRFDEISAAQGALGPVRGPEVMYLILNQLELAKLDGIMDTPEDQPFWPGNYEPFKLA